LSDIRLDGRKFSDGSGLSAAAGAQRWKASAVEIVPRPEHFVGPKTMKPKFLAAEDEAVNRRLSVRQTQRRKLFRPGHKFLRGRYWGLGWRVQDMKAAAQITPLPMAQLLIFSSRTFAPEPVSKFLWFLDLAPLCALYALL
jgi:hypothetical protein